MINIIDKNDCVGCLACQLKCPKHAISNFQDDAGFIYPIVNQSKCIDCGLCDKVCPTKHYYNKSEKKISCALAWNKDNDIRKNSTSGGVFSALMDYIFDKEGVVCGAILDEKFNVRHTIIENKVDMKAFNKAKYIQSDLCDVFTTIKDYLKKNIKVLFSGTPCQVSALYNYLVDKYDNLYTVEVICHGVVSQKIYNKYLESLSNSRKSKIKKYEFRNKDISWSNYTSKAIFENGEVYQKTRDEDSYMIGYLKHSLYLRPSCTNCKYKRFPRVADITLGDFWGIEKIREHDADLGVSAVIINSESGLRIFNGIKNKIYVEKVELEDILQENSSLVKSTKFGKYSNYFFKKFDKMDFIDLIHKIDFKDTINRPNLRLIDKLYLLKQYYINK